MGMRIPAIVALLLAMTGRTEAQDRLPPIPADKLTGEQQKAVEEFKTARKTDCCAGPFVPLLRSPEAMSRARAMGDYFRFSTGLAPRLSEFVILLTARHWTQQYEWNVHYPVAIQAGVTREVAAAIAEGRRPPALTDDEEILYNLCSELQQNRRVADATYARALKRFGEKGVIDVVGIVGYYTFLAMVLNTAQTSPGETPAPTPVLHR